MTDIIDSLASVALADPDDMSIRLSDVAGPLLFIQLFDPWFSQL